MSDYIVLFVPNADHDMLCGASDGFNYVDGIFDSRDEAYKHVKDQFEDDETLVDVDISGTTIYVETTYGSYKIQEV